MKELHSDLMRIYPNGMHDTIRDHLFEYLTNNKPLYLNFFTFKQKRSLYLGKHYKVFKEFKHDLDSEFKQHARVDIAITNNKKLYTVIEIINTHDLEFLNRQFYKRNKINLIRWYINGKNRSVYDFNTCRKTRYLYQRDEYFNLLNCNSDIYSFETYEKHFFEFKRKDYQAKLFDQKSLI